MTYSMIKFLSLVGVVQALREWRDEGIENPDDMARAPREDPPEDLPIYKAPWEGSTDAASTEKYGYRPAVLYPKSGADKFMVKIHQYDSALHEIRDFTTKPESVEMKKARLTSLLLPDDFLKKRKQAKHEDPKSRSYIPTRDDPVTRVRLAGKTAVKRLVEDKKHTHSREKMLALLKHPEVRKQKTDDGKALYADDYIKMFSDLENEVVADDDDDAGNATITDRIFRSFSSLLGLESHSRASAGTKSLAAATKAGSGTTAATPFNPRKDTDGYSEALDPSGKYLDYRKVKGLKKYMGGGLEADYDAMDAERQRRFRVQAEDKPHYLDVMKGSAVDTRLFSAHRAQYAKETPLTILTFPTRRGVFKERRNRDNAPDYMRYLEEAVQKPQELLAARAAAKKAAIDAPHDFYEDSYVRTLCPDDPGNCSPKPNDDVMRKNIAKTMITWYNNAYPLSVTLRKKVSEIAGQNNIGNIYGAVVDGYSASFNQANLFQGDLRVGQSLVLSSETLEAAHAINDGFLPAEYFGNHAPSLPDRTAIRASTNRVRVHTLATISKTFSTLNLAVAPADEIDHRIKQEYEDAVILPFLSLKHQIQQEKARARRLAANDTAEPAAQAVEEDAVIQKRRAKVGLLPDMRLGQFSPREKVNTRRSDGKRRRRVFHRTIDLDVDEAEESQGNGGLRARAAAAPAGSPEVSALVDSYSPKARAVPLLQKSRRARRAKYGYRRKSADEAQRHRRRLATLDDLDVVPMLTTDSADDSGAARRRLLAATWDDPLQHAALVDEPATTEPATTEPATTEPATTESATVWYTLPSDEEVAEASPFSMELFARNVQLDSVASMLSHAAAHRSVIAEVLDKELELVELRARKAAEAERRLKRKERQKHRAQEGSLEGSDLLEEFLEHEAELGVSLDTESSEATLVEAGAASETTAAAAAAVEPRAAARSFLLQRAEAEAAAPRAFAEGSAPGAALFAGVAAPAVQTIPTSEPDRRIPGDDVPKQEWKLPVEAPYVRHDFQDWAYAVRRPWHRYREEDVLVTPFGARGTCMMQGLADLRYRRSLGGRYKYYGCVSAVDNWSEHGRQWRGDTLARLRGKFFLTWNYYQKLRRRWLYKHNPEKYDVYRVDSQNKYFVKENF